MVVFLDQFAGMLGLTNSIKKGENESEVFLRCSSCCWNKRGRVPARCRRRVKKRKSAVCVKYMKEGMTCWIRRKAIFTYEIMNIY